MADKPFNKIPLTNGDTGVVHPKWNDIDGRPSVTTASDMSSDNLEDLLTKLQNTTGGKIGSSNITKDSRISSEWYNFVWMPHRNGYVSGSDNNNYGTLLLFTMTSEGPSYKVRSDKNGVVASIEYIPTNAPTKGGIKLSDSGIAMIQRSRIVIDLSDDTYDQNKWYPVTGSSIPADGYYETIGAVSLLNQGSGKATWSKHWSKNVDAHLELLTYGSWQGATLYPTIILDDSSVFIEDNKRAIGFRQLTHRSVPVFYLRGGAKYYIYASYDTTWTVHTSKYLDDGEEDASVVDVLSSEPDVYANKNYGYIYANLNGNASSATKLSTVRTIQTNLGSTTAGSFDGSANVEPGVKGTLPVANGGTGATDAAGARRNLGILDATQSSSGLMSADDKKTLDNTKNKLDSLAALTQEFNNLREYAFVLESYNTANEDLTTISGLSAAFANLRTHMFVPESA